MRNPDHFHHVREGVPINITDMDQEVWCPNVGEWMTRAEHQLRFNEGLLPGVAAEERVATNWQKRAPYQGEEEH